MSNFTDVEWLINNYYANDQVYSNFHDIGRQNLHKIDITKLKRADSQIALLRNLPNFFHIDNIATILQSVTALYKQ
jgi:hypothetical protein